MRRETIDLLRKNNFLDFSKANNFVLTESDCSRNVCKLSGRSVTRCSNHICSLYCRCILLHIRSKSHGSHGNDVSFSEGCLWVCHTLRSATVHILTSLLTSGAAGREVEELHKAVGTSRVFAWRTRTWQIVLISITRLFKRLTISRKSICMVYPFVWYTGWSNNRATLHLIFSTS